jgi:hypothetical protein
MLYREEIDIDLVYSMRLRKQGSQSPSQEQLSRCFFLAHGPVEMLGSCLRNPCQTQ